MLALVLLFGLLSFLASVVFSSLSMLPQRTRLLVTGLGSNLIPQLITLLVVGFSSRFETAFLTSLDFEYLRRSCKTNVFSVSPALPESRKGCHS